MGGFRDENKNKCPDDRCQQHWGRVVSTHKILRQAIQENMKGSNLPVWVIEQYAPTTDSACKLYDSHKKNHAHIEFDEGPIRDLGDMFR